MKDQMSTQRFAYGWTVKIWLKVRSSTLLSEYADLIILMNKPWYVENDDQNLIKGRNFSENDGLDVPNQIIQKWPIDCCHKTETKQKKILNRNENLTLSAIKRNLLLFFSYFHFGKWMRLGHAVLKKGVAKRRKNVLPEWLLCEQKMENLSEVKSERIFVNNWQLNYLRWLHR